MDAEAAAGAYDAAEVAVENLVENDATATTEIQES